MSVSWTQEHSSDRRVSSVFALLLLSERVSALRRTIPSADDAWFRFRFTAVLERGLIFGMAGIEAWSGKEFDDIALDSVALDVSSKYDWARTDGIPAAHLRPRGAFLAHAIFERAQFQLETATRFHPSRGTDFVA